MCVCVHGETSINRCVCMGRQVVIGVCGHGGTSVRRCMGEGCGVQKFSLSRL